jgi:AcrR family transcriptional regulator
VGTVTSTAESTDGRTTRWEEHRRARRSELVETTLAAIRRHGAGVGMEEIATFAGTSKTVLYRHFADRAELYLAVCARVEELVERQLRAAMAQAEGPREMISASIGSYLAIVESDPEVYRFVVHRPGLDRPVDDPVSGLTAAIGDQVAAALAAQLAAAGRDTAAAGPWGHGLVGLVHSATDHWLGQNPRMHRAALTDHLTQLTWAGLSDVLVLDPSDPGAPAPLADPSDPGAPAPAPTQEKNR